MDCVRVEGVIRGSKNSFSGVGMSKKSLSLLLCGLCIASAVVQAAPKDVEQAKKDFEKNLLVPCEGKTQGAHVIIKSPQGLSLTATCKMTAVVDIS